MKATRILPVILSSIIMMLMTMTYLHTVLLVDPTDELLRKPSTTQCLGGHGVETSPGCTEASLMVHDFEHTVDNSTHYDCFSKNSKRWLGGKRLGNHHKTLTNHEFVARSILGIESLFNDDGQPPTHLLQQTLCHEESRFLSMDLQAEEVFNPTDETIHSWSLRLIYLAAHIHQHLPALAEAKTHLARPKECQSQRVEKGLGLWDYECPSAKFLVVSMGRLGLGAVMRLGVVNALIAGIASNRTVLVVNDAPVGPKFLREPWLLASCPRRDMQCFYMPLSPCVLTTEDLANATALQRGEGRALFRSGQLPDHLVNDRVLLLDIVLRPQRTPYAFRENTVRIIQNHMINPLKEQPENPLIPLLNKAANFLLEEEELQNGSYYYFGHNSKHNRALVFYAMRPNLLYARRLKEIMLDTIPADLDPDLTFGLPIRDSDKCDLESECMSFHQYMNMTSHTWSKHSEEILQAQNSSSKGTATMVGEETFGAALNVIVTSESASVHDALLRYQEDGMERDLPVPARFVSNAFDVHQGTGNPGRVNRNISMDDVMLSSVSSLKSQFYARYTMGNCCSNFHLLLFDFLRDGCGASQQQHVAQCMQDHEKPEFRLCCHWSKSEECAAKRERQDP